MHTRSGSWRCLENRSPCAAPQRRYTSPRLVTSKSACKNSVTTLLCHYCGRCEAWPLHNSRKSISGGASKRITSPRCMRSLRNFIDLIGGGSYYNSRAMSFQSAIEELSKLRRKAVIRVRHLCIGSRKRKHLPYSTRCLRCDHRTWS